MSITLNAKGTSVPFFTVGKNGTTIYQGTADPQLSYSLKNSDLWLDTYNISLKMWSTSATNWVAPKIGSTDVSTIIPAQTNNSGKFLTTDGTNVSWATVSGSGELTLTGDVTGSGTGSFATTLATVNSSPQTDTFRKITVNAKGLVTATSSVASTDITTALGYTPYNSTNPSGYTSNTGTVTSVAVSGGTTGLTTSGGPITGSGTITLAGTLAVANGGTGQTTYTDGQLLIGNSSGNTLSKSTLTAGTGVTISNGNGTITISANISAMSVVTRTANYSASLSDGLILANGAITVTIPTAASAGSGKSYLIKKINSTGTVSVIVSGNGLIDDGLTANITMQYASITVVSDGAKYWII